MKKSKVLLLLMLTTSGSIHSKHLKKINNRVNEIEGNIEFWSYQQKEHAEFGAGFTSNDPLKKEGQAIADKFNQLHNAPQGKKSDFLQLTMRIKKFLNNVRSMLKENEKDYSIKIALIDHMNLEADYAEKKVRGKKLTKNEELKFWMKEHKGEAEAISYFMTQDPELKEEADELAKELQKDLSKPEIFTAREATMELDEMGEELESNPEKTRMPHKLAEHEKRERDRAKQTFKQLATINQF